MILLIFIEVNKKMKKKFKDRKINSIYFDNYNNKCVLENLNGFANRFKLRMRWYNRDDKNITFETKIKKGNKTQKIKENLLMKKVYLR